MKTKLTKRPPLVLGLSLLFLYLAISTFAILSLVRHEKQRDYNNWQITLGVMADERGEAITEWLEDQFSILQSLAQNGSVQLYSQQLMRRTGKNEAIEPAQISFLRTLLHKSADKNGFLDTEQAASPIQANISFEANNGMALIDNELSIITATPGVHNFSDELRQVALQVLAHGKPTIFDLHLNKNHQPTIGFFMPVYGLQRQNDTHEAVAVLYAFKNANKTLFPLFTKNSPTAPSAESYIIRKNGESITYISPLIDGTLPLRKQIANSNLAIAAAFAAEYPGSFGEGLDYSGNKVLLSSRKIAAVPWILVQKITTNEALNESSRHKQFLTTVLFLTTLLVAVLLVAAWWYGSSSRAQKAAIQLLEKSHELETQTNLLNAINENSLDYILLTDADDRIIFANSPFSKLLGISQEDCTNKTVTSLIGPDVSSLLRPFIQTSLRQNAAQSHSLSFELVGIPCIFHVNFTPVAYQSHETNSVLVVLHDVTKLQEAQAKKENIMQQLVNALMHAIDLHDPHSANHSAKTAKIASAIGKAMGLEPVEQRALVTAANLCNIGKLFIPKEILTKTVGLSKEERQIVRKETIFAQEILKGIDFEGPVLQTITQKHEHLDGSGYPEGISADEILVTSRILALANAFVAMTSPRSYREGLSKKEAFEQLLRMANSHYDRKIVAALFHVAENKNILI